jgi:phosphatidylglycerol:prolipoprotein diacylglycerol transferase
MLLIYLAWGRGWLKMPGALAGVFLTGYGLARSFVEMFRQPDQQFVTADNPIGHAFHFGEWGLTMGQLLSMPMVLVGLALIVFAKRVWGRKAPPRRAAM